ncbi:xanthine dehydrogenase family protein molybdopterin-binding subunit [Streptomyces radicis]|uniref:Xanthine dehydrogenase family protein molybdopterin-binding subunit n=1 Tax=Streptomyces radicis TaxID=1750517 RepID=A0A3A9WWK3_9ACTN|nr:xanthine dehydrogenase family protein molybdopterin-binding subunit [Streptomyces radicis]RKN12186.1 xanthine dehydrogenase family protein molybdopterin-binding subunit [Streptomyces radicis]RKN25762.1 xanthine dehydrogenase family protein molybdopterin-binding subunit [Streptomyces radicis]
MTGVAERAVGAPLVRRDGPLKVTGRAAYAYEQPVADPLYLFPIEATVARGRIVSIDAAAAEAADGVVVVLTHRNAARLAPDADPELRILQDDVIRFRNQFVGAVVAETSEAARYAAGLVRVEYEEAPHDVTFRADHPELYAPESVNAGIATDSVFGDVEMALAKAHRTIDHVYSTPLEHHNPMEPHTTVAAWHGEDGSGRLTLHDSNQGASTARSMLAPVLGIAPERVRVISPYVGGGFGSKAMPHAHVVLAVLAARLVGGRPVKFAMSRRQTFTQASHRSPQIQRVRLGADRDGRLTAIAHGSIAQTSRFKEFVEQTTFVTRSMYAAPNRSTTHRAVPSDVSVPGIFRAPGETPGFFALESAMDEMALACGIDPVEFRVRNEPEREPETGLPFSSRDYVACMREGARRFGWEGRDPAPGGTRAGEWLIGTGMAGCAYPAYFLRGGTQAAVEALPDGRYRVDIAAADIGTGAWTALAQVSADALGVPVEDVDMAIGDSALPPAAMAGGSMGMTFWGTAIIEAARVLRERFGERPEPGARVTATAPDNPHVGKVSMHAYGAHFAEVRVNADTGEVRVSRLLGMFDLGRVINPRTTRSQLIGGMIMGLSMALHEEGVRDPRFGHTVNCDLAQYHIAAHADVEDVDAIWLDGDDRYYNPMGAKGVGETGIVGAAAAIANAAHHATGIRVRDLPMTPEKFLR